MGHERPEVVDGKKAAPAGQRLVSLDAYRGFTMLAMISGGLYMGGLLNHPVWGGLADQFDHREWIGCSIWDLIQPSFMFIVGAAMPFSFAVRRQRGQSWALQFGHALKRALLLIAIGVFLDNFNHTPFSFQLIRVLQQIALGYVLAFLVLYFRPAWQAVALGAILVLHTGLYLWYGQAHGCWPWEEGYNVGTYLDRLLHLQLSEGGYATLNFLSSTATILAGVLCGELLRGTLPDSKKLLILGVAGVACLWAGLALTPWVPMVKRIWTASFAVYAAGWTILLLLAFYAVIDVFKYRRWTFPLVVVGMNSIAIYTVSGTLKGPIKSAFKPFLGEPFSDLLPVVPFIIAAVALVALFVRALPAAFRAALAVAAVVLLAAQGYSEEPLAQPIIMAALVTLAAWGICYWLYRQKIFFKV